MSDSPEKVPSDEVDETQLQQARAMGEAYMEGVEYMASEVAHTGGIRSVDDYVVGFAQEEAEGLWAFSDGDLEWQEPGDENCHLEVAVADGADERFVPGCDVTATFSDGDDEYGPFDLELLWHPGIYHYGANLELPDGGSYDIDVAIDPPTFHRHDRENGDRYGDRVEVTFTDVDVKTGQD